MDYYSNVTNTNTNANTDTYNTDSYVESTSDNVGDYADYESTSPEEFQKGEWVWVPDGYNPPGYNKPATYQTAQSRQGILSLVNAQQLVRKHFTYANQ